MDGTFSSCGRFTSSLGNKVAYGTSFKFSAWFVNSLGVPARSDDWSLRGDRTFVEAILASVEQTNGTCQVFGECSVV